MLILLVFLTSFLIAADATTVKVGVYDNPPKVYRDANGNVTGFWAEMVNSIAADEGWDVQYVYGTFADGLARLEKNEIDIMVDVTYTDDRAAKYAFANETVLIDWSVVYVRADSGIESPLDLEGKRIAVLKGSSNYVGPAGIRNVLSSFEVNAQFVETSSYDEAFALVRRGEAVAVVTNRFYGNAHKGNDLKETTMLLSLGKSKFALTKGAARTPELIGKLDARLHNLKMNLQSVYYSASKKYLGGTSVEVFEVLPPWVPWAFGGLLIVLACAAAAILLLRESEQLYRSLVEKSPIPMVVLDLKGRVTGANTAILARTGYKLSEVSGKHYAELIEKESVDVANAEFKRRLAGVPGRDVEVKIRTKSGLVKQFVMRGEPISKKGKVAVLVVFREIAKGKTAGRRA